jgi:transcriptional regulator with XRE-family HTH domain
MSGHENRREAFRAWMAANDLSPADVARRATIPPTTIYSYLDGKSRSLRGDTEQRIAQAFNVAVEMLFTSRSGLGRDVGVWGKIGARADVFPLSDYADDPMYEVALPPGLSPDEEYVAFEIEGFSMPPAEPGWLVVFRKVETTPEDLINSACLVDTADGRRLFKRLRRGYSEGLYNLESWDGSPLIENVEITNALPFAALTPGRKAR